MSNWTPETQREIAPVFAPWGTRTIQKKSNKERKKSIDLSGNILLWIRFQWHKMHVPISLIYSFMQMICYDFNVLDEDANYITTLALKKGLVRFWLVGMIASMSANHKPLAISIKRSMLVIEPPSRENSTHVPTELWTTKQLTFVFSFLLFIAFFDGSLDWVF